MKYRILDKIEFEKLTALPHFKSVLERETADTAFDALSIFNALEVNHDLFSADEYGVTTIDLKECEVHVSLKRLIELSKKLTDLKNCENFSSFSRAFKNPEQFTATAFEIDCAYFALTEMKIKSLIFEPTTESTKKPDFKITMFDDQDLYCECKSIENHRRGEKSRVVRLFRKLMPYIANHLSSDLRIEIYLRALPENWENKFIDLIVESTRRLKLSYPSHKYAEINFQNTITIIKICKHTEERDFINYMSVADGRLEENPRLVISEMPNLKKDIKNTIRYAASQLPNDRLGLIFCQCIHDDYGAQAAMEYMEYNTNQNLLGIMMLAKKTQFIVNRRCSIDVIEKYCHKRIF